MYDIIDMEDSQIQLFNGDCLEVMKTLDDKSVDLIFCDLPYGQTSCKWDCKIDLEQFWKQVMRIKKLRTPIFFTTTTKFGVDLIQSAPKKCHFRYDLVWVKTAPTGFLCAKKMPMRKHEMIYVFYEKLPFYDLSSHTHKFIKDGTKTKDNSCYGVQKLDVKKQYDPPLPVSVVKEDLYGQTNQAKVDFCLNEGMDKKDIGGKPRYDPPLPVSVVKETEHKWVKVKSDSCYGGVSTEDSKECGGHQQRYDPPLPTTMLEIKSTKGKHSTEKPVALMEWIFKYYSKEGDTILDPTMGSGSTGVACKNMNRKFIGIEMDKDIFEVATKRLN